MRFQVRAIVVRRPAFTLVELLVVIAIIVVLLALLLPAIQRVREAVAQARCGNNLRQLGIGLHNYQLARDEFPPAIVNSPMQYMHSWAPHLLPYIEQSHLHADYHWDHPWSAAVNQRSASAEVALFVCPAAPGGRTNLDAGHLYGLCDYSPISDLDPGLIDSGLLGSWQGDRRGIMAVGRGSRMSEIKDGASNTLLLAEVAGRPEHWIRGRRVGDTPVAGWASANLVTPINLDGFSEDGQTRFGPCAVNCNNQDEIYSFHHGGAAAVFGDGRVVFLRQDLPVQIVAGYVTRAGGERLPLPD